MEINDIINGLNCGNGTAGATAGVNAGNNNGVNNCGFGGWWIWIILLLFFFGYGGMGVGGNNSNNNCMPYYCTPCSGSKGKSDKKDNIYCCYPNGCNCNNAEIGRASCRERV